LNAQLQNQFLAGFRILQQQVGEPVMLDGISYSCTAGAISTVLDYLQGGAAVMKAATISIAQADLPNAPLIGAIALLRGNSMRVAGVDNLVTLWKCSLVQQFA
jgi:hypothetical protein